MTCPRDEGHGSGPFPRGQCYTCHKRAVLAGQSVPPELRLYAGFPPPRPPEPGWRRADQAAPALEEDRPPERHQLGSVGLALLRALAGIGRAR